MSDDLDTLERLADLRDRGILTAQEFDAKKRELLAGTSPGGRQAGVKAAASAATAGPGPAIENTKKKLDSRGPLVILGLVGLVILLAVALTNRTPASSTSPTRSPSVERVEPSEQKLKLTVTGCDGDGFGYVVAAGTVANNDTRTARRVTVTASTERSDDTIVDSGKDYLAIDLRPGQTAEWRVRLRSTNAPGGRCTASVEWQ